MPGSGIGLRDSDLADALASEAFDKDVDSNGDSGSDDDGGACGTAISPVVGKGAAPQDDIPGEAEAAPVLETLTNMPLDVKHEDRPQPEQLDRETLYSGSGSGANRDRLGSGESSVSSLRNSFGRAPGYYSRQTDKQRLMNGSSSSSSSGGGRKDKGGPVHQGGDNFMALS